MPTVLVEGVEDHYYLAVFAAIARRLRALHGVRVDVAWTRSLRPNVVGNPVRLLYGLLHTNAFTDAKWLRLYRPWSDGVAYYSRLGARGIACLRHLPRAFQIWRALLTKEDVLALTIDDVVVGDLVYDAYLRFRPAVTVRLGDRYLLLLLLQTLCELEVARSYVQARRPTLVLLSYSTYIQHGVLARIALAAGSPVFTFSNYQEIAKHLTASDWVHTRNTRDYRRRFAELDARPARLAAADQGLSRRLGGGIDAATAYMKESAYRRSDAEIPDLRGHLVVFLHDFFDSPHCYGTMVFNDFFEWIEFTLTYAERRGIPLCVKQHPNEVNDSRRIVERLRKRFSAVRFLDARASNVLLARAGMVGAVTVYGTVAHEMAYLGIPTISCGDNPHVGYSFCHNATDRMGYATLLESLAAREHDRARYKLEAQEFYYMHNLSRPESQTNLQAEFLTLRRETMTAHLHVDLEQGLQAATRSPGFDELIQQLVGQGASAEPVDTTPVPRYRLS